MQKKQAEKSGEEVTLTECPVVALRQLNVFPGMLLHFDIRRKRSVEAVNCALKNGQKMAVFCQRDVSTENPEMKDLYKEGTLVEIKQITRLPNRILRVLAEGKQRARLVKLDTVSQKYISGTVLPYEEPEVTKGKNVEETAMRRVILELTHQYTAYFPKLEQALQAQINEDMGLAELIDKIAVSLPVSSDKKQQVLSAFDVKERYKVITSILYEELQIAKVRTELLTEIKEKVEENQREYILKEQLAYIRKELQGDDSASETDQFYEQAKKLEAPEEIREKIIKEIRHYETIANSSSEGAVVRSYIETLLELPWDKMSKDNNDLENARKVLDKNHYGMDKVKERVLEFMAVRMMTDGAGEAPIICLVGPPGTGKTSIAKSMAEALNKKYERICLGGVKDEAEIRGHRKTMMGQVATSIKRAGVKNPLILLDEIDKVSTEYRGDTFSALLEVLDPDQNRHFRDHYVELPIDLSQVLFIATANSTSTIPRPLLDRMEVIEVSGYTENEKFHIAKEHLMRKQFAANGMTTKKLSITDKTLKDIISYYTRESGVRELERKIGTVCRKAAMEYLSASQKDGKEPEKIRITSANLKDYLGKRLYSVNMANRKNEVGIVRGLAWTEVGGVTLQIEVNVMPGKGEIELTGQMGDVMRESARIGYSYIRSVAGKYGIHQDFFKKHDLHIHIPEGAVPKDGPSAGITMATAMLSAITKTKVNCHVAMTGEITLRGKVLPIGGLKEKLLAANVAGIKKVLIPEENRKDVEEISEEITDGMELVFIHTMDDVIQHAFQS